LLRKINKTGVSENFILPPKAAEYLRDSLIKKSSVLLALAKPFPGKYQHREPKLLAFICKKHR